jgi:hypothetical protein
MAEGMVSDLMNRRAFRLRHKRVANDEEHSHTEGGNVVDHTDAAMKVADILGPSSAAARALRRRDEIIAAGLDTHILLVGNRWLVKEPDYPGMPEPVPHR